MTTRTHSTTAQPALGFVYTPTRDNQAYAIAAGLVPASSEVARVVTVYPAVPVRTDTRRADLHHVLQAALNALPTAQDLDPEAGKQIAAADAALRALLKRIDAA
jgi:hypothetical protein